MINNIISLDSCNNDLIQKAKSAQLILGDLYQTYSWNGETMTKEESNRFYYEAEKILGFISIAIDYVYDVRKGLEQFTIDLDVLFDKAKQAESVSKDVKPSESKEQINVSLSEIATAVQAPRESLIDNDFKQFVYNRCDKALLENEEFKKIGYDDKADPDDVLNKAQELCYQQGFNDAMQLILNSKEKTAV